MSAANRIDTVFAALGAQGRQAVIPYIACGDPYADATVDIMRALIAHLPWTRRRP